jgi:GNAT superfamily N-acetyltransferase
MTTLEAHDSIQQELREFAEHPGRYLTWDDGGSIARHVDHRRCIVVGPTFGVVTSIDVADGELPSLLEEVRELIPDGVRTDWFLGPSMRPDNLDARLLALGLHEPEDGSGMLHALLIDREPTGIPASIETHEVTTMSDFSAAAELRMEVFGLGEDDRERERAFRAGYFEDYVQVKDRSTISVVATIDGRVAGAASALLSDRGLFLIGGATAEWARGRGVYRALVGARWRYAVARGTPALTVHAIHDTSSPILRRLGFEEACTMRHLEGRPT